MAFPNPCLNQLEKSLGLKMEGLIGQSQLSL